MKPIAITLGDPAGIGSEVVLKAIGQIDRDVPLWLFGDWNFARQALPSSKFPSSLIRVNDLPSRANSEKRLFIDIAFSGAEPVRFGSVEPAYGQAALDSINAALEAIDDGRCGAMVNAPIHKQAIATAGSPFTGHTELLAAHSGLERYGRDYAMYFDSPTLRVALLSVHVSVINAIRQLNAESIVELAALLDREFRRIYGSRPRIAVAGVNPHAGEGGIMGDEDEIVKQGVDQASDLGIQITGPLSPDTVFLSTTRGKYDVVMAIYHDQGLIPVKTLDFEHSVNVTLGLPYLRCSVDHGTAFDIAGKGIADEAPMKYAIEWAMKHAASFRKSLP